MSFFLSGFYFYYLYRFPKAPERDWVFKYYPEDIVLKTGTRLEAPENRIQYFLNFPAEKPKDTIRIGAFGCSYTYSQTAYKEASYPRQLQIMLKKHFPDKKIEVLNFGIRGAGFDETFFLWEKYSADYGIDYVLFGPRTFHPNRELTFRASDNDYFEYPKERFVLSNGHLQSVHIKGKSIKKRYKNYYSLFPSWTALRYDIKPFKVWEWGLKSDFILNPFYYKSSFKEENWFEESSKIYLLLFKKIEKTHPKKIFILKDAFGIFEDFNIESPKFKDFYNIHYINHSYEEKALYRHTTHYSSLGYEIPAVFFFNALVGNQSFSFNLIKCFYPLQKKLKSKPLKAGNNFKLSELRSIKIKSKKTSVLHFHNVNNYQAKELSENISEDVKSFLGFMSPLDFGNTAYIPLSYSLENNLKVYIKIKAKEKIEIGAIKALDPYEKLFNFYGKYIIYHPNYFDWLYGTYFMLKEMPSLIRQKLEKALESQAGLELLLEDDSLGILEPISIWDDEYLANRLGETILKFIPHGGYNQSLLMMGNPDYISEKKLSSQFPLHIEYLTEEEETFKAPVLGWTCEKQAQSVELNLKNFKPL